MAKDMTKWRKTYPELSRWALKAATYIFIRGNFETETHRRKQELKKLCYYRNRDWCDVTTSKGMRVATRG